MNLDTALYIVVAIAILWFGTRIMLGKRAPGSSLSQMFTREKHVAVIGLGPEAIRTLVEDTLAFEHGERAIRGVILAGPFAAKLAGPEDEVAFIMLADDLSDYRETSWRARWPYPQRGHLFLDHRVEERDSAVIHRIALRGAPPIAMHFVPVEAPRAPEETTRAVLKGAKPLDTGTDAARRALARWGKQTGEDA